MRVNADFSLPVVVQPQGQGWVPSPQPGVERIMLDRIGGEVARATSLVRYAPGASFPSHVHAGGEEILVLSGTFSDEMGDYPAGWYLRHPPGSAHRPSTAEGAVIFVKLRQMAAQETEIVRVNSADPQRWITQAGRECCPLFHSDIEDVSLQRLAPGQALFDGAVAGAEILVLAGELMHEGQRLGANAWLRLPAGAWPQTLGGTGGVTVYLKRGRLGLGFDPQEPA